MASNIFDVRAVGLAGLMIKNCELIPFLFVTMGELSQIALRDIVVLYRPVSIFHHTFHPPFEPDGAFEGSAITGKIVLLSIFKPTFLYVRHVMMVAMGTEAQMVPRRRMKPARHTSSWRSISESGFRTPFDPQCCKDASLKLPRNACLSATRFQSLSYLQDLLGVGNDRDPSPRGRA